jgi:hypothetical protein
MDEIKIRKRKNDPILDRSKELSDKDMEVITLFIDGVPRREAYRQVYKESISDSSIYNWFRLDKVTNKLKEYELQLDNYNVVCDKVLLNVITSKVAQNKDKIAAIKLWAALRDRIKTRVVVESEKTVNLENVTDDNLELIINAITNGNK